MVTTVYPAGPGHTLRVHRLLSRVTFEPSSTRISEGSKFWCFINEPITKLEWGKNSKNRLNNLTVHYLKFRHS